MKSRNQQTISPQRNSLTRLTNKLVTSPLRSVLSLLHSLSPLPFYPFTFFPFKGLPLLRPVFLLFSLFTFLPFQAQVIDLGKDNNPARKLQIAEMAIKGLYVDKVDEQKLVEDGIRGMLEKLDPHSSYSTAKETKAMNEPLQGSFDGIGVQFNMVQDTLLVIQPVLKGPSEKVGILAGDRIVSVNDTAIAGVKMAREEIVKRLRGPRGTKVKLTIVRRDRKSTRLNSSHANISYAV